MLAVIIPFWRITKVTKNGAKRTYKEFFWKIQCRYYVRIHRIGPPRRGPVPRIIVGRLEHYDKKEEILQIQRDLSRSSKETPFHVSEQFPAALVEERKHLFELQSKYTSQNAETRVRRNKLVFKNNGNVYREKRIRPPCWRCSTLRRRWVRQATGNISGNFERKTLMWK